MPIFAMVDTNSDPRQVDYVIPANDDASKSIDIVLSFVTNAIADGLSDRKADKEKVKEVKEAPKKEEAKVAAPKAETEVEAPAKEEAPKTEATDAPAEEKK
ncbi:MAG: small subunit ribosomal protein S2 [Polaribacter sp.]